MFLDSEVGMLLRSFSLKGEDGLIGAPRALGSSGQRPRRPNFIKRDEAIGDEDELDIVDTARHDEQAVLSMCTDRRGSRYKLTSTSICQNS